jgi:acetyltransferase-like isoleucine patch superfamily enzyme
MKSSEMIAQDVKIGERTKIQDYVNLYGCEIGNDCMVGPFVEIQNGARVGNRVRIQSHSFLCTGVVVEDDVFIGHGVMFNNDLFPPRFDPTKWKSTIVRKHSAIGNNSTILPVEIGEWALIGAGSVVTHDVSPYTIVAGNPARFLRLRNDLPTNIPSQGLTSKNR